MGRVLVVDDEVTARATLAEMLREQGHEVEMAADAFKALGKCEGFAPHVVVTDLQMPGMDGIELVRKLRARPEPPAVIVMTAFGKVESAVEAMRAGAADYLTKPFEFDALVAVLGRVLDQHQLHAALRERDDRATTGDVIGTTPAMQRILQTIAAAGPSRAAVLITGEAGTGKELVATALHRASPRAARPLIVVRCEGLTEAKLELELFGHEQGGLNGATVHRDGKIVQASGGTLFIDQVSELPPALQIRFLRVLKDYQLERVGGTSAVRVDVRVLAASRHDLALDVAQGKFREDLYYALRGVGIVLPPLRERLVDLPKLAKAFIRRYAQLNGKLIEGLSPEALEVLSSYHWPGNVRELEAAIEQAVVLTRSGMIEPRALPESITEAKAPERGAPKIPGATMADIERYAILETMQATGGSTSKAAEILGISTRTVQNRLHQYHEAERSERDVVRKPADK